MCEDLTEGKFSFPIIHAIQADRGNHELLNILGQRPEDESIKNYAVNYMSKMGSFEYCKTVSKLLAAKTMMCIRELEGEDMKDAGDAVRAILAKFVIEE